MKWNEGNLVVVVISRANWYFLEFVLVVVVFRYTFVCFFVFIICFIVLFALFYLYIQIIYFAFIKCFVNNFIKWIRIEIFMWLHWISCRIYIYIFISAVFFLLVVVVEEYVKEKKSNQFAIDIFTYTFAYLNATSTCYRVTFHNL